MGRAEGDGMVFDAWFLLLSPCRFVVVAKRGPKDSSSGLSLSLLSLCCVEGRSTKGRRRAPRLVSLSLSLCMYVCMYNVQLGARRRDPNRPSERFRRPRTSHAVACPSAVVVLPPLRSPTAA
jgi:hypothetical protein